MYRSSELAGLVCLSPLQLAIMERKKEVVAALLRGLGEQALPTTLSVRLIHLKKVRIGWRGWWPCSGVSGSRRSSPPSP